MRTVSATRIERNCSTPLCHAQHRRVDGTKGPGLLCLKKSRYSVKRWSKTSWRTANAEWPEAGTAPGHLCTMHAYCSCVAAPTTQRLRRDHFARRLRAASTYAAICLTNGVVLISILRGSAAAATGAVISRTPFTNSATNFSVATPSGSSSSRSNLP
jgi:hypothetical protein